MELTHLHTFITVAEEKSITRAAKRLFTTPSAVSMHIKALEDELNIQLFVRTSRGVELTEKGERLKSKADDTVQAAREFVNCARDMQEHLLGRVTVGLNATAKFLRVPALIAAMRAQYPAVELHFANTSTRHVLEDLRAGKLDVGFLFGGVDDVLLVSHHLHVTELVVAAPRAWQTRIERAGWGELARLPWIYADSYCPFQDMIDGLFAERGLTYKRSVQSDDEMTKAELVAAGVGLTLLEKSEACDSLERVAIYDTPPLHCDLALVYLKHRQHEPLVKALAQQIIALWHSR